MILRLGSRVARCFFLGDLKFDCAPSDTLAAVVVVSVKHTSNNDGASEQRSCEKGADPGDRVPLIQ